MPKLTGGSTVAAHKAAVRDAILDAFAAEFHATGWPDLTLQTIAKQAGVSRTAVYNYFPDKTALLLGWSEREMTRFLTLAHRELDDRTDPVDRVQVLVKLVLIEFSLQQGVVTSIATLLSPQDRQQFFAHVEPLGELVEELVRSGIEVGVFAAADPGDTTRMLMACLEAQRPSLLAGERVDAAVARTLPFVLRALGTHP
ncbi:TetR/AcrR family transcriptional regulator [Rhodococcus sp. CH91]|uniref:TetR/AcrR family transcriptional regulator n=1 Tax=Rhodococcus sp. CH91 TaxID=2910256 RepID=UPI001F4A6353|nr:TetR/AcrR family transcriptional regulator [Rhodococcus sp. CH91]